MRNYRVVFIEKATKIHDNFYEYDQIPVEFKYNSTVTITCPIHGNYDQRARTHVMGSGCISCANEKRAQMYNTKKHTKEQFIQKAKSVHGNKYDYSDTVYRGQMKKLTIRCQTHGVFNQLANNHIHGNGCARCSDSKGERLIAQILTQYNVVFEQQKTFAACKNYNRKKPNVLPFDFYLPKLNTLIEYDGEHHFKPIRFNGVSEIKAVELHTKTKENDTVKTKYANTHNISLMRLSYLDSVTTITEQIAQALNHTTSH